MEDEKMDEQEKKGADGIVARYNADYGHRVDSVIAEIFKEMAEARDGDSMLLLQKQLLDMTIIIREKVGAVDMVVLSDEKERGRWN